MFATTRRIVGFSLLTGISLAGIIGWVTGWWARLSARVDQLWSDLVAWATSPVTMDHILAVGAVVLVPIALLAVLFVLTDR